MILLILWSSLAFAVEWRSFPPVVGSPYGSMESDPGEVSGTSVRTAAREGRIRLLKRLIAQGVDLNSAGEFGETALMYAARFGHVNAARMLIEGGARVDERDRVDRTPLMFAAINCSDPITGILLKAGANANLRSHSGRTALMYAAEEGCLGSVAQLVRSPGIDLGAKDARGRTALDLAGPDAMLEVGGPYTEIRDLLRGPRPRPIP
jgi:ankyrin repeat protein